MLSGMRIASTAAVIAVLALTGCAATPAPEQEARTTPEGCASALTAWSDFDAFLDGPHDDAAMIEQRDAMVAKWKSVADTSPQWLAGVASSARDAFLEATDPTGSDSASAMLVATDQLELLAEKCEEDGNLPTGYAFEG